MKEKNTNILLTIITKNSNKETSQTRNKTMKQIINNEMSKISPLTLVIIVIGIGISAGISI